MTSAALPQSGASAPASSTGFYDPQVVTALHGLVGRYGVGLLGESGRLRGLLNDECPQAKREISVLLQALDERIPQDLLRVHSGEPIQSLSPRLARRLVDEKSLSPAAASWAVQAWAQGLGVESVLQSHPQFAAVDDLAGAGAAAAVPPGRSSANESWGAGGPPAGGGGAGTASGGRAGLPKSARTGVIVAGVVVVAAGLWFGMFSPKAEITGVQTEGPLVADGRPHPVQLDIQTRNTSLRAVDVRFVRGDVTWAQPSWTVNLDGAPAAGKAAAGTLSYRADRPVNATFEYTLVSADGKRSAPFERSFTFLPPVTITGVQVPRPLQVGRDFAVAIIYKKGGADIVQVERRVVNSSVPMAQEVVSQPAQVNPSTGSIDYRFEAAAQPLRSTMEFVLVDAQGVRSQPYQVAVDVGSVARAGNGPATVVAVNQVAVAGQASGAGAVVGGVGGAALGNRFGQGSGKTAATVLGAVIGGIGGHMAEKNIRSTVAWNTTVQFDDGTRRTIRTSAAPQWQPGDRVEVNGNSIRR